MKTQYFLSLILISSFSMLMAQNTVGTTLFTPELSDGGYNLIYPHNQSNAYLLDMCGNIVHTWEHADTLRPGNVLYILENSDIITTYRPASFSSDPIWAGGGGATVEKRTWDNDVLWTFTRNDSSYRLHHDVTPMANGNVLVVAWEQRDSLECIAAGRDTTNLTGAGIWSEVIWEIQPTGIGTGAEIVWEWAVWDNLIQDFDSTKANFGVISDHPELIDLNFGLVLGNAADWLHVNAIDYDEFSQHVMISVPTFNEMWIIDHSNTTPGLLKWRWGNPMAYGRGDSTNIKLGFQHHTHWLDLALSINSPDFGKIGVFNNRQAGSFGEYSSVHTLSPIFNEYENLYMMDVPGNTGTYLPTDFDWSFVPLDSSLIYSNIVSSFQRLENGNSYICSGKSGDIREFTSSGELVWHYKTPLLNAGGTASPVSQGTVLNPFQNLTFRAYRYPTNYAAFDGITLISDTVIELNPTPLPSCINCDLTLSLDSITQDSLLGSIFISASGSYGLDSILWYNLLDSTVVGSGSLSLFGVDDGTYLLSVTDTVGCTASLEITVIIDGINTPTPLVLGIYPNPSNGEVNIVIPNKLSNALLELYNLQGKLVWAENNFNVTGTSTINLRFLPAGTYQLLIRSDEGTGSSRIVIQH